MKLLVSFLLSLQLATATLSADYLTAAVLPSPVRATNTYPANSDSADISLDVSAPSVILMEASTGTIIC